MKPSKWKITVNKNWVKSPERSVYTSWRSLRHPDFRTGLQIDTGWWCSYLGLLYPLLKLKIYFSIGSIFHFLNLKRGSSWLTCFLTPDIVPACGNQSQVHFISNVPGSDSVARKRIKVRLFFQRNRKLSTHCGNTLFNIKYILNVFVLNEVRCLFRKFTEVGRLEYSWRQMKCYSASYLNKLIMNRSFHIFSAYPVEQNSTKSRFPNSARFSQAFIQKTTFHQYIQKESFHKPKAIEHLF